MDGSISTDPKARTQGGLGVDSEGRPVPRWSDDPLLTKRGLSGAEYIGTNRSHRTLIEELQIDRTQLEEELGINPPTEFSPLEAHGFHVRKTHLIELRESTEKILDAAGSSLTDYFKFGPDGSEVLPGPNDEIKTDWTDVSRGLPYLDKDGVEKKDFDLPSGTKMLCPTFPANTRLRAIHIEDLRHIIPTGWKEYWSVSPLGELFYMPTDYSDFNDNGGVYTIVGAANPGNGTWLTGTGYLIDSFIDSFPYNEYGYFPNYYDIHPSDGGTQYQKDGLDVYPHDIPNPKPDGPTTEPDKTWIVSAVTHRRDDAVINHFGYLVKDVTPKTVTMKVFSPFPPYTTVIDSWEEVWPQRTYWSSFEYKSQAIASSEATAEVVPELYPQVLLKNPKAQSLKLSVHASMAHEYTQHDYKDYRINDDPEMTLVPDILAPSAPFNFAPAVAPYATAAIHKIWQLLDDGSNQYGNPIIPNDISTYAIKKPQIIKVSKGTRLKYLLNVSGTGNATINGLTTAESEYINHGASFKSYGYIEDTLFAPYSPSFGGYDGTRLSGSPFAYLAGSPYAINNVLSPFRSITVNPRKRDMSSTLVLKKDDKPLFITLIFEPIPTKNIVTVTAPFEGQTFNFLRPSGWGDETNNIVAYVDGGLATEYDMDINIDDLLTAFKTGVLSEVQGHPVEFNYISHKLQQTDSEGNISIVENPDGTPLEFVRLAFNLAVNSAPSGTQPSWNSVVKPVALKTPTAWELRTYVEPGVGTYQYEYPIEFNTDPTDFNVVPTINVGTVTDGGLCSAQATVDAVRIEGNPGGINVI